MGNVNTPPKETGEMVHDSHINGLVLKELGNDEDEDTIKEIIEKISVKMDDDNFENIKLKIGAVSGAKE